MERSHRIGFVAALALTAVVSRGVAANGLAGTQWKVLDFVSMDDSRIEAADPERFTVEFAADGTAAWRLDCNRGRGSWESASPGQLALGELAMTRAACPPDPLGDRLAEDIPRVRSYVLRDGHLFLSLMADGGIYELAPLAAGGDGEAEGSAKPAGEPVVTRWQVVERVAADGTRTKVEEPEKLGLEFRSDGTASFRIDCNAGQGFWSSPGAGELRFGPVALTQMACPPDPMADRFQSDLDAVRAYEERGGHLFLTLEDGAVYELAPPPPPPPEPERIIPTTVVQFASGRNRVVLHGQLESPDRPAWNYRVAVPEGKTLQVAMRATNRRSTEFEVLLPGSEQPIYRTEREGKNDWKGKAEVGGDYTVRIYLADEAASRPSSSKVQLTLTVY